MKTLALRAGTSSAGKPAYEEIIVEQRGDSTYELLASPGLVLGLAAGDTIRITSADDFEIVARGGNVCVQLFRNAGVDNVEPVASEAVQKVRGRLDGKTPRELVYTIPVSVGFPAIENSMRQVIDQFPDAEWFYGNVYDPADGVTPLNWWP